MGAERGNHSIGKNRPVGNGGAEQIHIASFSGGKDSAATIILAHEHNEPLELIIFSEVMFDEEISGELPEHISFIKETCIPLFKEWGYETKILRSEKTYMSYFNHIVTKSRTEERNGKKAGFPMAGKCAINRDCKVKPIKDFLKSIREKEIIQYLGIAADEPKRLERLQGTNKVSLLDKYGYTEKMAFELCKKYGLLSPIYDFAPRGGCWFCPNARDRELRHLRENHPELWQKLLELENEKNIIGYMWNMLTKTSIASKEEFFYWEDAQMTVFDFV